jgi:hypothetical protein
MLLWESFRIADDRFQARSQILGDRFLRGVLKSRLGSDEIRIFRWMENHASRGWWPVCCGFFHDALRRIIVVSFNDNRWISLSIVDRPLIHNPNVTVPEIRKAPNESGGAPWPEGYRTLCASPCVPHAGWRIPDPGALENRASRHIRRPATGVMSRRWVQVERALSKAKLFPAFARSAMMRIFFTRDKSGGNLHHIPETSRGVPLGSGDTPVPRLVKKGESYVPSLYPPLPMERRPFRRLGLKKVSSFRAGGLLGSAATCKDRSPYGAPKDQSSLRGFFMNCSSRSLRRYSRYLRWASAVSPSFGGAAPAEAICEAGGWVPYLFQGP